MQQALDADGFESPIQNWGGKFKSLRTTSYLSDIK
jgi:hypothetical protein